MDRADGLRFLTTDVCTRIAAGVYMSVSTRMTTESTETDCINAAANALAHLRGRAGARALMFRYVTTAITTDKTFRERQISICHNKTPRQPYVNTKPRACAYARASRGLGLHGAGMFPPRS
jgi:hypothetical protein